jgi:hydroxymethylglutaryl-CoA lyase
MSPLLAPARARRAAGLASRWLHTRVPVRVWRGVNGPSHCKKHPPHSPPTPPPPQRLFNADLPPAVTIVDVGPRDGLQNEATPVPAAVKIGLIHRLADAGVPVVEATSFVSPKWVPQLADAADVMGGLVRRPGTRYPVLTPNATGLARALAAGATDVAVFAAATEAFSRRNLNAGVADTLARYADVVAAAREAGARVRGYVSVAAGCPYEGAVPPAAAARVAAALHGMGCYEVSMGDTVGVGTPATIAAMFQAAADVVPLSALASHCHDTYGQGVANVLAALAAGVATHDTSVAGLGGCPFAPGATGERGERGRGGGRGES